jgi:hypothetical protein
MLAQIMTVTLLLVADSHRKLHVLILILAQEIIVSLPLVVDLIQ